MNGDGYRRVVHGGPAGRSLLAVALVALPLIGLALLVPGGSSATPAPRDAVLRVGAGQGPDAQAVRSGPEADPAARRATGARAPGLVAVLVGAAAALAATGCSAAPPLRAARVRTGRGPSAAGRGPPLLLHR